MLIIRGDRGSSCGVYFLSPSRSVSHTHPHTQCLISNWYVCCVCSAALCWLISWWDGCSRACDLICYSAHTGERERELWLPSTVLLCLNTSLTSSHTAADRPGRKTYETSSQSGTNLIKVQTPPLLPASPARFTFTVWLQGQDMADVQEVKRK